MGSFNLGLEILLFDRNVYRATRKCYIPCFNLGLEILLFDRQRRIVPPVTQLYPVSISDSRFFSLIAS